MINAGVVLVFPKPDKAAQTIWSELEKNSYPIPTDLKFDGNVVWQLEDDNRIYMIHSERDGVFADHLETEIKSNLFIFISRHSAASGRPALLVHATGNWSKKTLGGEDYELSYTSARALRLGLEHLQQMHDEYELINYTVNIEVTHHGPTKLKTPLIFMELGSTAEQWVEKIPARAVGEAALKTAKTFLSNEVNYESCIGVGGNHYAYRFHRYLRETYNIAVGHIAPKYVIDEIDSQIIKQAIEKTHEKVDMILIDKKGTRSEQRKKIQLIAERLGKEVEMI